MQVSTQIQSEKLSILAEAIKVVKSHNRMTKPPKFEPYEWQKKMFAAGKDNAQRMLMGGNRIGKTASVTYELFCHLTGIYPDWWEGIKFDRPTKCWVLGVTGEQIRDVLQDHIFGKYINDGNRFFDGDGWIPNELVQSVIPFL